MQILTMKEAKTGLGQAMDDVCRDHEPVIIVRRRSQHVVLISLGDFELLSKAISMGDKGPHNDPLSSGLNPTSIT
jgi:antitoxin YefM